MDVDGLTAYARQNELVIRVLCRPGEFVVRGAQVAVVHARGPLPEEVERELNQRFVVGRERTPEQDLEFAVDQLVEVAVRALSPGINDPGTAIACIDWLGAAISEMAHRDLPPERHYDSEGALRLVVKAVTFRGLVDAAFNQIRQYGAASPAVAIRLLESLRRIAAQAKSDESRDVLRGQGTMVRNSSLDAGLADGDRKDVEGRFQELLAALSG